MVTHIWGLLDTNRDCVLDQRVSAPGELLTGGAAIAAPIYNAAGEVFASMTISGPLQRVTPSFVAKIAPLLRESTLAISAQLGYIPRSG